MRSVPVRHGKLVDVDLAGDERVMDARGGLDPLATVIITGGVG